MRLILATILLAFSALSQAAIKTEEIPYQSADGTQLLGGHAGIFQETVWLNR